MFHYQREAKTITSSADLDMAAQTDMEMTDDVRGDFIGANKIKF